MLGCVLKKLYNISIDKITIKKSKYGKPFLFPNSKNIKIGISHCQHIIAVAVSNCEIGVDVEKVEKLKSDVFCYGDFFSDDELLYIDCFLEKSEIFTVFWTRKEALIKRFGLRICDGLKFSCFEKETRSFMLDSVSGKKYAFSYSFSGDAVDIYRYNGMGFSKFFKTGWYICSKQTIFDL